MTTIITHCKDTDSSEPASCLLSTLTTMEPEHTHLWRTWQGSITSSVLTACATQEAQESSAPGTGTVWQGEEVAEARTKAKSEGLLAEEALRNRGLGELHVLEMQVKGGGKGGTSGPQDKGSRACFLGTSKLRRFH